MSKELLSLRASERGSSFEVACAAIVSRDGDIVAVDIEHPAYPRYSTNEISFTAANPTTTALSGPGTELKKLLKTWLRIEATPNCSCNARARRMDEEEAREPGWCEFHLEEIVGWLREEATKRGLPFVDMAGRVLVRRAISNAQKEQARAEKAATTEGSDEA